MDIDLSLLFFSTMNTDKTIDLDLNERDHGVDPDTAGGAVGRGVAHGRGRLGLAGRGRAPFDLNLHDDGNGMSGDQSEHAQGNCASSFIFCAACIICACPVNIIAFDAGGDEENAHAKGEHGHSTDGEQSEHAQGNCAAHFHNFYACNVYAYHLS